jgi:hypothetical protein
VDLVQDVSSPPFHGEGVQVEEPAAVKVHQYQRPVGVVEVDWQDEDPPRQQGLGTRAEVPV